MTHPTDGRGPDFTPSAEFTVPTGERSPAICFVGDEFVAGHGDPKALGWVSRVLARTEAEFDIATYNLGIRGQSSTDAGGRWRGETEPRWVGANEHRLVLSLGTHDIHLGMTLARSRLNLANILDEAAATGIASYVVGPPPSLDEEFNQRLEGLVDAQADVCGRRGITYVDCFRPLLGHTQWVSDLTEARGHALPGQAGYGLIAWLVLHTGWQEWLKI